MQSLNANDFKYLTDEPADFLEEQSVKTSDQDRFSSFCNTLRGYEEFILNAEGIIISSNLEAVNVTGYEEWEVIGKHFSLFYLPDDIACGRPDEDLFSAREAGKIFYSANRVKKKGVSFWAKIRITTMRDHIGAFCGYRMVIKDTTHNALYNYRVKRVRDEYLNLFNNSFIGIFKFRLNDSKILLINEKAKQLLGVNDWEDLSLAYFFSDHQSFSSFVEKLLSTDETVNTEIHLEHQGLWLSVSCRAFPRQGFAEGILVDITEKKKQMAELQRLNQEIDKFIYHSSHDMRSPLTTILGLTHLIALEHPNATVGEYNSMIRTQVNHLDTLLKSLVNITFNKTAPAHEIIDFNRELEVILRDFRHQYQHVRVHTYCEGSQRFFSDPARIHIILKNLISNAFRFHNPHIDSAYVNVKIVEHDSETVIKIADNGIGIDEDCVDSIFTMFYKAERGSTGLGLYIVKSMVDKLGGTIEVRSKRWEGSTFTVKLPNDPGAF
ncbi:MAG TPA: ATP-binding protein [Chryseosolibacter sp.]|nr:ATP-binding protein [Chryseosolibacter sp.]